MEENEIKNADDMNKEENDPMIEKDDDVTSSLTNIQWDDNKYVWDLSELEILNN